MKSVLAVAILVLTLVAGCDDDATNAGADSFLVRITITDPSGAPVEGLQISAAPDLPQFYQDGVAWQDADTLAPVPADGGLAIYPSPFYPVAAIEFTSVETSSIRLTVDDIEGRTVDVLIDDGERPAGRFSVNWAAPNAPEGPAPGGVYFAYLVLESGGEIRHEETVPMLYVPLYPDQFSIGTTDDQGRLDIIDARYFPQLYDLPPIPARDETGVEVATIQLGPETRFYARDPATGDLMRFDHDVDGSCRIDVTWEPSN